MQKIVGIFDNLKPKLSKISQQSQTKLLKVLVWLATKNNGLTNRGELNTKYG